MDFDFAAQRLKRDQETIRPSSTRRNLVVSQRAKRQADAMKRRQLELRKEKQTRMKQEAYRNAYMNRCERALGIRSLKMSSSVNGSGGDDKGGLELHATSIHGDGDKITLPPSVLGFLTEQQISSSSSSSSSSTSPWIFRVGIRNPKYTFPASSLVRDMQPPNGRHGDGLQRMDEDDDDDDADNYDEDDTDVDRRMDAYLDELNHKYLSYTHATVVEFTQEEGYVGLPELISKALLHPSSSSSKQQQPQQKIPVRRTVDPAAASQQMDTDATAETKVPMEVDDVDDKDDGGEKTPGHLAWGAFDIPDMLIEITLVKLPKGMACKLRPTQQAIMAGFYNLKDMKFVLEQSLIRTRATLSTNDTVYTWHRGIKYDVKVTSVKPSMYDAIVCINTDIEVDFDAPEEQITTNQRQQHHVKHTSKEDSNKNNGSTFSKSSNVSAGDFFSTLGGGRTLSSTSSSLTTSSQPQLQSISTATATNNTASLSRKELPPEPPIEQKQHVCIVQLRGDGGIGSGGNGRRRFDVTQATVGDLFAFAYRAVGGQQDRQQEQEERDTNTAAVPSSSSFSLVTRFPRRVFTTDMSKSTLQDAGISQGQELFMIERL